MLTVQIKKELIRQSIPTYKESCHQAVTSRLCDYDLNNKYLCLPACWWLLKQEGLKSFVKRNLSWRCFCVKGFKFPSATDFGSVLLVSLIRLKQYFCIWDKIIRIPNKISFSVNSDFIYEAVSFQRI